MTTSHLSVQLYTVRELLEDDLPGTIARLADLGFTNVEPFDFTRFTGLGDALASTGLSAPTTHAHFLGEDARATFEAAAALGIQTVIDPYVPAERWQSPDAINQTADQLAAAAEAAAEFGLRVGYHNHNHELESVIDGTPALEVFAAKLAPGIVLEVDTYWAAVGGQDPVALLKRLGGDRVTAIHVKDGPGSKDNKDQVAVGAGSMPIRDIVEAVPDALRVIELDDSREDRFQAVADSIRFLAEEGLA